MVARTLRRRLQLWLSGQQGYRVTAPDPAWRRLLFIHDGMPQIGDALMDLAPRSLLVEHGLSVDLAAPDHIASLFQGDSWFGRVLTFDQIEPSSRYDATILLSDDRRALRAKHEKLTTLPWLSLQGLYNGPDFHRARFSTQRFADWFGLRLTPSEFARHAAHKLVLDQAAVRWAAGQAPGDDWIVLVLGGVVPHRTYTRWVELCALLRAQGHRRWLLVGSTNGRGAADELVASLPTGDAIVDLVDRTDLHQAQALAARARLVVCADGGLMHLALTTPVAVLGLFNSYIAPAWRMTDEPRCLGLRSSTLWVNDLAPSDVAVAVGRLWAAAASDSRPVMPVDH